MGKKCEREKSKYPKVFVRTSSAFSGKTVGLTENFVGNKENLGHYSHNKKRKFFRAQIFVDFTMK